MGCDTVLTGTMHLIGTNLYFEWLTIWSDHCGVEGLVHIRLRHSDIVLETSRNWGIHLMDNTKCRIAILNGIHNNTHCEEIIDLIQGLILILHLLIDTEDMLGTALYSGLDLILLHSLTDFLVQMLCIVLSLGPAKVDLIGEIPIGLRL